MTKIRLRKFCRARCSLETQNSNNLKFSEVFSFLKLLKKKLKLYQKRSKIKYKTPKPSKLIIFQNFPNQNPEINPNGQIDFLFQGNPALGGEKPTDSHRGRGDQAAFHGAAHRKNGCPNFEHPGKVQAFVAFLQFN